jgi:hypothetical protein
MKKLFVYPIILFALVLFGSCEKYFEGLNKNPDEPSDVPLNVITGGVQGTLAYSIGGDAARHASIYSQHINGVSRQWAVLNNYGIVGEDMNTLFEFNLYADVLMELKKMKEKASEGGLPYYSGMAKAMEAYTLLFITDFWGDAPYLDAFQGVDNLQPAYDSQTSLFQSIFALLSEADQDLSQADGGAILPGSDDLIYAGDPALWGGFVNFVRARAYLRLAKTDPTQYGNALTALGNGGLSVDAAFPFSGGALAANPMYQFNEQRGDCEIGGNLQSMLTALNDPRSAVLDNTFDVSHPFITESKGVALGSMTEQKFIEAECEFQVNGAAAAHSVYLDAINLSMTEMGISATDAATYIAQASVDPGAGSLTLENIITQKYLALFMEPEVFTDWRRTGFPVLSPNSGTQVPRRFPYPQRETDLNTNTPSVTIFTPVNWDL